MLIRNKRAISAILHQLALAAFVYLYADGGWAMVLWFAGLQVPFGITALLVLTRTGNGNNGAGRSGKSVELFRVWLVPIVLAAGVLYLLDLTTGAKSTAETDLNKMPGQELAESQEPADLEELSDSPELSDYGVAPAESGTRLPGFIQSRLPDPIKVGAAAAALGFLHLWVLLLSGPDGARSARPAEAPAQAEADPLARLDLA